jgi:thioredoxin-related protein
MTFRKAILSLLLLLSAAAAFGQSQPYRVEDVPPWFTETFLDIREDVRDAARERKRLLLYFGQDGCPYCRELMVTNFTQAAIVQKTRTHFVAMAFNIWGDREVTWTDGTTRSEKDFARFLKVQFSPTLLMLDEKGAIIARMNGYYPPHRFEAALDFGAGRLERRQDFASYMRAAARERASERLHDEPFFKAPPYVLTRKAGGKPLAVLFETPFCSGCDELHREGFKRPEVRAVLERFDVVRLVYGEPTAVVTPAGAKSTSAQWARTLKVGYTPSMVLFDDRGTEVIRIEAYLRPFHLASALEYVAGGAYRSEPNFQRFVQARAERLRDRGETVDVWK